MTTIDQNIINHVALVLDASGSMSDHSKRLVEVAEEQIEYLADRSKELDQETRVSVYSFDHDVRCLVFDKDVLRLPKISGLYRTGGQTALIDAVIQSQQDLEKTATMYGNHAFLTFLLTDGAENINRRKSPELIAKLAGLPENYTIAVLVPDARSVFTAKGYGFSAGNITTWDAMSKTGTEGAVSVIRQATDSYMTSRSTSHGTYRGTRSIFDVSTAVVNRATVAAAGMVPLDPKRYMLVPVIHDTNIKDFIVNDCGRVWQVGRYMYPLSKRENIQSNKMIAIVGKKDSKVYLGDEARTLLGLPDMDVTVAPNQNQDYAIYVQSTSNNRKLVPGTKLLILL